MKTIIVTGVAGFIGSHVAKALLTRGDRVVGIDDLNDYYSPEWKKANITPLKNDAGFIFFEGDIRNQSFIENIWEQYSADAVIHLAARAGVRPSLEFPLLYESVNVGGTLTVLEACRKFQVKKVVFASSSSVYGNQGVTPFTESMTTDFPLSPYAATKKAGEVLCATYSQLYKISCTCLRFFTVYGPGGRPDMAPYLFTKAILDDKPIVQYGDGSTARDYTYIDDIVQGVIAALEVESLFEAINLGNNQPVSLHDFISTIERITGKKAHRNIQPIPAGDMKVTFAETSKAKNLLHYQPHTDIETGMTHFIEWYKKTRL